MLCDCSYVCVFSIHNIGPVLNVLKKGLHETNDWLGVRAHNHTHTDY